MNLPIILSLQKMEICILGKPHDRTFQFCMISKIQFPQVPPLGHKKLDFNINCITDLSYLKHAKHLPRTCGCSRAAATSHEFSSRIMPSITHRTRIAVVALMLLVVSDPTNLVWVFHLFATSFIFNSLNRQLSITPIIEGINLTQNFLPLICL